MRAITKTAPSDPLTNMYVVDDEYDTVAPAAVTPTCDACNIVTYQPSVSGWSTITYVSYSVTSGMLDLFEFSGELWIDGVNMTNVYYQGGGRH